MEIRCAIAPRASSQTCADTGLPHSSTHTRTHNTSNPSSPRLTLWVRFGRLSGAGAKMVSSMEGARILQLVTLKVVYERDHWSYNAYHPSRKMLTGLRVPAWLAK